MRRRIARLPAVKNPFEFYVSLGLFGSTVSTPDKLRVVLGRARRRAKKQGMPFSLTPHDVAELWESQRGLCALCLLPFSDEREGTSFVRPLRPSLDRIVPADSYHRPNVRLTHAQCNMARNEWGDERFAAMCRAGAAVNEPGNGPPSPDDPLALSDAERQALIALLRHTLDEARFPYAPRLAPLKAILAKLVPPPIREPLPPPKVYAPPSRGRYRRRE
jgi:hypothetical protein